KFSCRDNEPRCRPGTINRRAKADGRHARGAILTHPSPCAPRPREITIGSTPEISMPFKPVRITGNRRQVGLALGKLGRPLMASYLDQSAAWAALRPWRGHAYLQELAGHAQEALPAVWEEFEGLAEGLRMPVADLLLWNCRGDLLHKTSDGCTSVALHAANGTRWIAHNEDGDPYLYGRCHVVDVQPDDAPGYVSFYYPGSLPGHTFAANRAGLVQTINNLRTRARRAG